MQEDLLYTGYIQHKSTTIQLAGERAKEYKSVMGREGLEVTGDG